MGRRHRCQRATRRSAFRVPAASRAANRAPPASASATGSPTAPSRSPTGRISTSRGDVAPTAYALARRHRRTACRLPRFAGRMAATAGPCSASPTSAARRARRARAGRRHERRAMAGAAMTNRRARGSAVVLAMVLAALAAVVAVTVLADQQRWARTVEHRRDQVQAQALAMAGVQWAREILDEDASHSTDRSSRRAVGAAAAADPARERRDPRLDHRRAGAPQRQRARRRRHRRGCDDATHRAAVRDPGRSAPRDRRDRGLDRRRRHPARRGRGGCVLHGRSRRRASRRTSRSSRIGELADVKGVTPARGSRPSRRSSRRSPRTRRSTSTPRRPKCWRRSSTVSPAIRSPRSSRRAQQKPFTTIAEFRARLPPGASLRGDDALVVRSEYFLRDDHRATGQHARDRAGAPASHCRRVARDRVAGRRLAVSSCDPRAAGRKIAPAARGRARRRVNLAECHARPHCDDDAAHPGQPPLPRRACAAHGRCSMPPEPGARRGIGRSGRVARGGSRRDRHCGRAGAHRLRDAAAARARPRRRRRGVRRRGPDRGTRRHPAPHGVGAARRRTGACRDRRARAHRRVRRVRRPRAHRRARHRRAGPRRARRGMALVRERRRGP